MGERVLLIIAPDLFQCHRCAVEWGFIPPHIDNFRNVTRSIELRSVRAGTPFITYGREFWSDTPRGFELDQVVTTLQRIGRLRIAQDDDIRAHRPFDDVPFRSRTGAVMRNAAMKIAEGHL